MRYLIIGGGIAGTTAAEELRKIDKNAEMTIVSEEQHALYSRVLLPHYLFGKIPRERVFLKKESWYEEQGIEWMRGVVAKALDAKNKFVTTSEGRELPYDKLLIASGGEVKTLPDDVRGVSYLRTLDDADHLLQLLSEQGESARGGIYGGGFIACEYINIFRERKIPTTIAFRGEHFWPHALDRQSGELLNAKMQENGITLLSNADWLGVEGESTLRVCKTSAGNFDCTILGVGIGIEPDVSWMKDAGLEVDRALRVNEFLETNLPDIYGAGDVVEYDDVIVGRPLWIGNWMNAQGQARLVAHSMSGERKAFRLVSSYATNLLGVQIIFIGDTSRTHADEVKIRGSVKEGGVIQLFVRAGRAVGATIVGRAQDRAEVTKLIDEGVGVGRWRSKE